MQEAKTVSESKMFDTLSCLNYTADHHETLLYNTYAVRHLEKDLR